MSCVYAQMNVEEEYERLMAALAQQHDQLESRQHDLYSFDPLTDTSAAVAAELDRLKVCCCLVSIKFLTDSLLISTASDNTWAIALYQYL